MQTIAPPRPATSSTPAIVGTLSLIWRAAYLALGVYVIVVALIREGGQEADQTRGYEWLFQIIAALVVAIGECFMLQGCLGVAAGMGTLLRKQWGRVLAFVVAVLSGLWGLLFVFGSGQGVESIGWGAVHLGYAILTFILLIKNGAAFTRRRGFAP